MDVNECLEYGENGVCQNDGTCKNEIGEFKCECLAGFNGALCEVNIDDCVNNLCYTGSQCIDGNLSYSCVCSPDRFGKFFPLKKNKILGEYCQHENKCFTNNSICGQGTCYPDLEFGNYTCNCDLGYQVNFIIVFKFFILYF